MKNNFSQINQRKLSGVLLAMLISLVSYSETVDVQKAHNVAVNFAKQQFDAKTTDMSLVYTKGNTAYVFSNENMWIMIAADDRAKPVLAYSTEGSFRIPSSEADTIIGDNFWGWVKSYQEQIQYAIANDILASQQISGEWQALVNGQNIRATTTAVNPLLTTTWGQGWPYNSMCPSNPNGPGGHVWAGCVATAMAQLIKYHNYPSQGLGSHGYQWNIYPYTGADYGNTTYNWANMPNSISEVNTDVATITYHAAVACNSMWGSGSTGVMWYDDQEPMSRAFVNYFRMAYSSLEYIKREHFDGQNWVVDPNWDEKIQAELLANRPVYYRGNGTGGHAWVCDGVNTSNMYHFNWGWDGFYNGYYSLDAVNAGSYHFNENQTAIIGIKPNDGSTLVENTTWSGTQEHISKIAVPDAITLTVNPGANILFAQGTKLQVYGRLLSIGTADNYVRFSAIDTSNRWHGIKWDNEYNWYDVMADNDSSKLIYTQVEYSGNHGLYASRFGKILVKNSKINNNNTNTGNMQVGDGLGGGIFVNSQAINIWNSELYQNSASWSGGGIHIRNTQQETANIYQNVMYDNMAGSGGAIAMSFGNANVIGNTIRNNQAGGGAGISISNSSPLIENNILVNNTTPLWGRGVLYLSYSKPNIIGNLIANNTAAGIYIDYQSEPTIINSTIVNNYCLYTSGIVSGNNSDAVVKNTIVYGNQSENPIYGTQIAIWDNNSDLVFDHCNIQGGLAGFGGTGAGVNYDPINYTYNIDAEPVFVNPSPGAGAGYDGLAADWSLQNTSPSINSGTPAVELPDFDYLGNPRIFGGRVDQGALENQHVIAEPDAVLYPERISFLTGIGETTTKTTKIYVVNYPNFTLDSITGFSSPFYATVNQDFEIDIQYSPTITGAHRDTLQIYCSKGVLSLIVHGESGYCESLPSAIDGNITIICEIIIPENDTLTILPGAKLNFFSNTGLVVRGTLIANGTENDSITFTASKPGEKWNGIVIEGASTNSSSQISYSNFQQSSNAGIEVRGNRIASISRSKFTHNVNGLALGGNADVFVTKSIFEYNGKGLHLTSSKSVIYDNVIRKNAHMTGAGITATWGGAKVLNNFITDNTSSYAGGGVYLEDNLPSFLFANNVVANNQVTSSQNDWDCGGGLCIRGNFTGYFFNNTIVNNKAHRGAGIAIISSNNNLQNNIIFGNEGAIGSQIYLIDANPVFKNCNVQGGIDAFGYLGPIIFNPNNYINSFSSDPQFVLPSAGAGIAFSGYYAMWRLSGQSSSINTGDTTGLATILPQYALGGGDRLIGNIDIGAYEYCDLNAASSPVFGPTELCEGNIITYSTDSIANLMSHWLLPHDWHLLSENGKSSITVKAGMTSGIVKVFPESGCGVGTPSEIAVSSAPLPVLSGELVGPTEVCSQSSHVYWLPQGNNDLFSYDWNFPADWTILYGQGTIFIALQIGNASGKVSVTANNECGQSPVAEKTVTTKPFPSIPGQIAGPESACAYDTLFYSVSEGHASYTYNWQLPTGWELVSGQGTNEICVIGSTNDGSISVTAINNCGVSNAKTLFVDMMVFPTQPSYIAGNPNPCLNSNQLYYVTNIVGTNYNWSVPEGWTINSGQGSNMITVSVGNNSGDISVTPGNSCGDGLARTLAVNVLNAPAEATAILGDAVVCQGENAMNYSVLMITNASSYQWTLPYGASGSSTSNNISVNFGSDAVSGEISVRGVNACGEGEASSLFVQVNPLPEAAGAINGNNVVCEGEGNVVYTTGTVQNADSYLWLLPSGANGSSTSNSITVNFGLGAISGEISVRGINACGEGEAASLFVHVQSLPGQPTIPFGPDIVDLKNGNETIYKIESVPFSWLNSWLIEPSSMGAATSMNDSASILWSGQLGAATLKVRGYTSTCGFGPWSDVKNIWVDNTTGIQESRKGSIKVFPNPGQGDFTVLSESAIESLELKDCSGKTVFRMAADGMMTVEVKGIDLAKGFYLLEVKQLDGIERIKVVIR